MRQVGHETGRSIEESSLHLMVNLNDDRAAAFEGLVGAALLEDFQRGDAAGKGDMLRIAGPRLSCVDAIEL